MRITSVWVLSLQDKPVIQDGSRGEGQDVQNNQYCTYSAKDMMEEQIKLISEEWTIKGTVIAFIDYPNTTKSDTKLVANVARGEITLFHHLSLNYTFSFIYEDLDRNAEEKRKEFTNEECRRGDVPIPKDRIIPLCVLAIAFGIVAVGVAVGVFYWRKNRSLLPGDAENPPVRLAADQDGDLNPQPDQDLDLSLRRPLTGATQV